MGGDALEKALEETGMATHPEIIRVFARIEKMRANDKMFTEAREGGTENKPLANQIYSTMK